MRVLGSTTANFAYRNRTYTPASIMQCQLKKKKGAVVISAIDWQGIANTYNFSWRTLRMPVFSVPNSLHLLPQLSQCPSLLCPWSLRIQPVSLPPSPPPPPNIMKLSTGSQVSYRRNSGHCALTGSRPAHIESLAFPNTSILPAGGQLPD